MERTPIFFMEIARQAKLTAAGMVCRPALQSVPEFIKAGQCPENFTNHNESWELFGNTFRQRDDVGRVLRHDVAIDVLNQAFRHCFSDSDHRERIGNQARLLMRITSSEAATSNGVELTFYTHGETRLVASFEFMQH